MGGSAADTVMGGSAADTVMGGSAAVGQQFCTTCVALQLLPNYSSKTCLRMMGVVVLQQLQDHIDR